MIGDGQQARHPLHVTNFADALLVLIKTRQLVEGKTFEFAGPKGYTYRRLIELFAHAAICPAKAISLPPALFYCYGRLFPEIRRTPFPYDTILQLTESEHVHPTTSMLGFKDLGFGKLDTLEDHLLAIARRYRRVEDFGTPLVFPPELLTDSIVVKK